MTILLLLLPARQRLCAAGRSPSAGTAPPDEYDYAITPDGRQIVAEGRAPAARLPAADTVIAVPAESDLSWRRVELPRAGRQMRAALAGMLEETLLEEPEALHFALEPDAAPGDTAWVAVASRPWLSEHLGRLEAAQVFVDRVAPLAWPAPNARGHFFEDGGERLALRWSHADGAATLPLDGGLSRQLIAPAQVQAAQWSASAAAAARAERWLGRSVAVKSPAQRALAVVDSGWNLRQFELAPRTRGMRALRQLARGLMRRQWRALRWGVAGLAAVQLLGINLLAWQETRHMNELRQAIGATLTQSFPKVSAVLDAPLQMQREIDALRAATGSTGEQDLETLLAAAALAWPADRGPLDALTFELGRLTLSAQGWSEAQIQQFRSQLRSEGWQIDVSEGRMMLSRATHGGRP